MELLQINFEEIRQDAKTHEFVAPYSEFSHIHKIVDDGVEKGVCIFKPVLNASDFIHIDLLFIYDEFRNSDVGSRAYDKMMEGKKCGRAILYSDIARSALIKRGWKVSSKNDNLLYKS